ncbi:MAG: SusE domain-containing protein [Sphingobacteriales bacterium]|nr:SusE domain-containing protein [Sphingobacteriales bacterium]
MKKLIQSFMMLSFIALGFSACKKDQSLAVLDPAKISASSLSASTNSLVLEKANQDQNAITFTYSKANFGFEAGATYSIQFAVKGTNFSSPIEAPLDANATTLSYKVIDFNALMLKLNLPFDQASNVEARVKAFLSSKVDVVYSTPVELSVKPYPLIDFIYVPGDYQGWNISAADSLMSPTGNGIYSGVIDFTPSSTLQFLLTPKKAWDHKFSDGGSGKLLPEGPNNLQAPTADPYKITADLNNLTIAFEKYSFGIIGDATPTGWGSDTNMNYNNGTRTWSITLNLIGGKDIKFRLNDDWGTNYGGSNGTISLNGANITIPSDGTYKVSFSEVDMTYSVVKQ